MAFKVISAQEAASHIENGAKIGFGGFTASGTPKVVSAALAEKAEAEHINFSRVLEDALISRLGGVEYRN